MHSDDVPYMAYDIGGERWVKDAPGFAEAIAHAFEQRLRPRCLCRRKPEGQGIEMYVASLMGGYIVKRMPNTGSQHATDCPSYDPPADLTGLGQLLGSAIVENSATGATTLKLDFSLTKMPGRSQTRSAVCDSDSAASDGTKLSLRGLLHYLWNRADLTRWHPGFTGKRTWATVRRHLLAAAEPMVARGDPLLHRLYLPEAFSVEQRDAISARRLAQWAPALAQPGRVNSLLLLIGEVKEIVPTRFGYKAIIKHVPDQAFAIDERLYRRLERRFPTELELWGADDAVRLAIIATFGVTHAGLPCINEMSLMTLSPEWIPIANCFEGHLVRALVHGRRNFLKTLRYNLQADTDMACALLTDTDEVVQMFIDLGASTRWGDADERRFGSSVDGVSWTWQPAQQEFPDVPVRRRDTAYRSIH